MSSSRAISFTSSASQLHGVVKTSCASLVSELQQLIAICTGDGDGVGNELYVKRRLQQFEAKTHVQKLVHDAQQLATILAHLKLR